MTIHSQYKQQLWNNKKFVPYIFIFPNLVLFIVFMIFPILMSGYFSLVKWGGMGRPQFIGLANYTHIFKDTVFLKSLWNTFKFSIATVPLLMIMALFFAVILNRDMKMRGFFRSALYLPSIISTVVVGMVFIWLFNSQLGLINYTLNFLGLSSIEWSNSPRFAMVMIIIGTLWSRIGYNMVIYLAALQEIPKEHYESAKIDGANTWQRFRFITIPMLRVTHLFVFITCVIHSFRSFDLIYVMTKGGPLNATKTMAVYIYETAFHSNYYGRASAGGIVLFLILLLFTIIRIKSEKETN